MIGGPSVTICGSSEEKSCGRAARVSWKVPFGVDLLHEVVALGAQFQGPREVQRRSVVDHDVDPAEVLHGGRHSAPHVGLLAHVADDRHGLPACGLDLLHGGVDGAGQPRVGLVGLREQDGVRARLRGGDEHGQPDPPAAARHDDGALPAEMRSRDSRLLIGTSIDS